MRCILTILLSLGALCAYGGQDSSFPWEELKELYRAEITQELHAAQALPEAPSVVSIDEARYQLRIGATRIEGTVELTGRLLSGEATPLPLFGSSLVLREIQEVGGASLLTDGQHGGTALLPNSEVETFRLSATFLARAAEDRGAHVLTLAIPRTVKNRVHIELDDGLRLLESPGISGPEGEYYFATTNTLELRYALVEDARHSQPPEADLNTRVLAEQRRVVLETQSLHVSFDETGRSLSTLHLELPSETGPRLVLEPFPGSEIWSLTVNGQRKQVYTDDDGAWIVPLDSGESSKVELAFLQEGDAVGLQGTLNVAVPRTGLAATMLYVGIDLPDRVELLSVEGPVSTTRPTEDDVALGISSATYVFSQPFYKGEGMTITIAYKEPVDRNR